MSNLKTYLDLPYTVLLRRDNEGDFVAKIDELPGCAAHGKTREEALANLDEAKILWIEDCVENGESVPPPAEEEALPSGKWLQRVPRRLHRKLQVLSRKEGVSFNQYVTAILAEAVGERLTVRAEQPGLHQDMNPFNTLNEYFVKGNYELVPCDFQFSNVSAVGMKSSGSVLLASLAHLSAQLPDRIEEKIKLKSRATKDEKKHTGFGLQ
ncbi:MAG TPA: type II toxin-antitoxin system HicB family antitoxin [Candidatus Acidoferrum sp.]|jgi:predicted RNase H-like HicB family nuclease